MSRNCEPLTVVAECKLAKAPGSDRLYYFDFQHDLAGNDTLDGITITVAEETSYGDLVIDGGAGEGDLLAADTVIDGKQLYQNKAITSRISGGALDADGEPVEYKLAVTVSTTNGDTIVLYAYLVITKERIIDG